MPLLPKEIGWLIRQAHPFRHLYGMRLLLVFMTSLLSLLDPLILKWLIDDVLPWRKQEMLWVVALAFLFIFVFRFGFTALSLLIDTYTSQRLMIDIRCSLLRHLQGLSSEYHHRHPPGDNLHRLEHDVENICQLGAHSLAALVRIAVLTTLAVTIMAILNWRLTLFILLLLPVSVLLRHYGHPRLKKASDLTQAANARRVTFLQEHLNSWLQVQLLNRGTGERRRFLHLARAAFDAVLKRRYIELALSSSTQLTMFFGAAVVLGFGGHQVLAGALSIGGLVAFYSYLNRIFEPTAMAITLYSDVQRASASIRRVMTVLKHQPTILETTHPRKLTGTQGMAVELQDIAFSYGDSQLVLDGLDLGLHPGEKVALVGHSGCGKSTITRLLMRLHDPQDGDVHIDGVPIADLALRQLRSQVALVQQDPALFDVSLRENLLYAQPQASDRVIQRVLAWTQLRDVVKNLSDGLESRVGQRGNQLSGGQRQRVAIARALLQQPRLLILDEATSALDGMTESLLLDSLEEALEGCTTLLIAHRLSAVRWADRIVVLDGGRVVASGQHEELYQDCALYRDLCRNQLEQDANESTDAEPEASSGRGVLAQVVAR